MFYNCQDTQKHVADRAKDFSQFESSVGCRFLDARGEQQVENRDDADGDRNNREGQHQEKHAFRREQPSRKLIYSLYVHPDIPLPDSRAIIKRLDQSPAVMPLDCFVIHYNIR